MPSVTVGIHIRLENVDRSEFYLSNGGKRTAV
jgi:hypothetical protein